MNQKKIKERINNFVITRKLPIAFYNSHIIELNNQNNYRSKKNLVKKYSQRNIPRLSSGKIISKIYEIL